ncbi:hypothetical protein Tco_0648312 [Tanacetum coccineum]
MEEVRFLRKSTVLQRFVRKESDSGLSLSDSSLDSQRFTGKDNGENILQSIDEGPFKMGKFKETLVDGAQGPERDRVFKDLTPEEKERHKADIRATNILLQGLPKDIYTLINHYTDPKDIWDNVKMLLEGSELTKDERESQLYDDFEHFHQNKGETINEYYVRFTKLINDMRNIKMTMPKMQFNSKFVNNMLPEWGSFVTVVKLNRGLKTSNYDQLYAYLKSHEAHTNENKLMLERYTQHAIDPLTFVSNVSLQQYPTQSSANPQSGYVPPQDNALTQSKPHNLEYFKDKMLLIQAQENGVVLDEEQLLFIAADQCDAFDSNVDGAPTAQTMFMANLSSSDPIYDEAGPSYDSNILSEVQNHDNYLDNAVKNNAEHVVQSNVFSVPNDALMMIINDMHKQAAQCIYANEHNKVVNESLTAKLARYKEQVKIYKKRARFELTEREQKIDEQLKIIITDRNIQEESLKNELHSVKMQLSSTIDHNKLMKEEVATLKKDFKQKENKPLKDFLDMKALKEKVEDKLLKHDQSLQMVHMLCKPKPFYDEKKKVPIGYKNPLYLTNAMQVQFALYNGHEIVKTNHAPAVVDDSEDTLELAEITKKEMLEKMKIP